MFCGLRLRGSRAKSLLHLPGSSTTGLVWAPFCGFDHCVGCTSIHQTDSKFLLQPKGLTSPPGYCGYLQHLNLSRKRGTPFKVCRISPFFALNAHSAPGSRLVFQRFSLGTHRFSSRRTEEAVAGDRLRPRRGCEDACNPLIFRKTLEGGEPARRLFVERDRACFPRGHFFLHQRSPDVDTPFSVQNGEFALYADRVTLNACDASAAGAVLRLIEEHGGDIEAWR